MERILQHVKPERRNKELERNPVHPLFWRRSFHFETVEQGISFTIPVLRPLLRLLGVYQRGFQNTLDIRKTELTFVDPSLPQAFEGFKILADSAIKSTPQKTIFFTLVLVTFIARSNESPRKSAIS